MRESLGGGVFTRLLSLWRYLKGETVSIVDAATKPAEEVDCNVSDVEKEQDEKQADNVVTYVEDGEKKADDPIDMQSGTSTTDTLETTNEFLVMLEEDHEHLQQSKQFLDSSCEHYRTDVPLEDLLHLSVGMHKNIEERVNQICEVVSEYGVPIELEKAKLPETVPEAVHHGLAKEKALNLKRGKVRRSQRRLYPTPRADGERPMKTLRKEEATDLKQLDLSKETRKLLELDSPGKPVA